MLKKRLMTPGPTPVHPDASAVLGSPQPHHRTPDFRRVMARTRGRLRDVFRTSGDVLILTSSGTGAMEASLVSLTRPGDQVVVVDSGKFGGRWRDIALAHGRKPLVVSPPAGQAVSPEEVARAVVPAGGATALFFAACESSTGVRADTRALAAAARKAAGSDLLVVVDAITELGAGPLETAAWDLDVVIGGAQKAFMIPPGLAFLALSSRAVARLESGGGGGYYFDLSRELKAQRQDSTAWTPASGLIAALDTALDRLLEGGGMEQIWRATQQRAGMTRAALQAMGLTLYAADPAVSLTAACAPAGLDSGRIVAEVERNFGVRLAGGQGSLKGKIFRIAHLGYIDMVDTLGTLGAVGATLERLGAPVDTAAGMAAAVSCMSAAVVEAGSQA
ncbi:MAG: alanine--glyoxylate aminotransferase family protein [Acidobacteria bacterium]|jgi:aspartate aminotransferase-like enzyme|nr:alanine--glyoxylate aminotransferase family protein [Acidobacteriota bacterium]